MKLGKSERKQKKLNNTVGCKAPKVPLTSTAKSNQLSSMQVFRDEAEEEVNIEFSSDEGTSGNKKSKVKRRIIMN